MNLLPITKFGRRTGWPRSNIKVAKHLVVAAPVQASITRRPDRSHCASFHATVLVRYWITHCINKTTPEFVRLMCSYCIQKYCTSAKGHSFCRNFGKRRAIFIITWPVTVRTVSWICVVRFFTLPRES